MSEISDKKEKSNEYENIPTSPLYVSNGPTKNMDTAFETALITDRV